MHISKKKRGGNACQTKWLKREIIEDTVNRIVHNHILKAKNLGLIVRIANARNKASVADVVKIRTGLVRRLAAVDEKLDNLADVFATYGTKIGARRVKALDRKIDKLYAEKEDVEDQLDQIAAVNYQPISATQVKNHATLLRDYLKDSEIPKSKRFLQSFIKSITIDGNVAELAYTIPMPPEAMVRMEWKDLETAGPNKEPTDLFRISFEISPLKVLQQTPTGDKKAG